MSNNQRKFYVFSAGVVVLLALLVYFRIKSNADEVSKARRPIPSVQLSHAQRGEIERSLSFTGDVDAIQAASIFSRVNGNIEEEYVDIGSFVQKGQKLALVDTTIYSQNARQARATLLQAEATYGNAKLSYERNRNLLSQNLVAKQDVDNSETAYRVALAQEEAAAASYKNASTQLGYCTITAPFTGYVTRRFFDPGTYVTASTNGQSSTLFYLADIRRVKVLVNIPEEDIPLLSKVQDAQLKVDAYPNAVFHGRITRISQQLDLSTRTMPVEVDVENPQNLLKPGMFANISLILARSTNALLLPSQVVLKDEAGDFVYTVGGDSVVHKLYVKIGISQGNQDEIVSGITDNDKIVFMGQDIVENGMKVRVAR